GNILRDLSPIFSASELAAGLDKLGQAKPTNGIKELKSALVDALLQSKDTQVQSILRTIGDKDPSLAEPVAKALARFPTEENWPYLVRGLNSPNKVTALELVEALKKLSTKPKTEDGAPFRAALEAASKFDEKDKNRWKFIELMRHWGAKNFGADAGDS